MRNRCRFAAATIFTPWHKKYKDAAEVGGVLALRPHRRSAGAAQVSERAEELDLVVFSHPDIAPF